MSDSNSQHDIAIEASFTSLNSECDIFLASTVVKGKTLDFLQVKAIVLLADKLSEVVKDRHLAFMIQCGELA